MKKLFVCFVALLASLFVLSGCGELEGETVVVTPIPTAAPETPAPTPTPTPEPVKFTVNSGDEWGNYGYAHFVCPRSGTYSFTAVDSQGIDWKVYLLEAEFDDAERFIPHANECALEGDGTLDISQGQYIYIYCTANSWTGIEARDGAKLECELTGQ